MVDPVLGGELMKYASRVGGVASLRRQSRQPFSFAEGRAVASRLRLAEAIGGELPVVVTAPADLRAGGSDVLTVYEIVPTGVT